MQLGSNIMTELIQLQLCIMKYYIAIELWSVCSHWKVNDSLASTIVRPIGKQQARAPSPIESGTQASEGEGLKGTEVKANHT